MVAVMDCVFFGRTRGYLVVRDPHRKENVYWMRVDRETLDEYRCARDTLESLGFVIRAVVVDGKPGLKPLHEDIPIQMCHFHMKAIIPDTLPAGPGFKLAWSFEIWCMGCAIRMRSPLPWGLPDGIRGGTGSLRGKLLTQRHVSGTIRTSGCVLHTEA